MSATPRTVLAVLGRGVVDPTQPVVRADDPGVTRGDGCFEGCRVLVDDTGCAEVAKLDRHLARMARSAAALAIPFSTKEWIELIGVATAAWRLTGEAALKLVLTRGPADAGPTGFLTISPIPADYPRQRREGLKVLTLDRGVEPSVFGSAPWLLGGVKTLSYAVNMAAQREAARRGADDIIFVTSGGSVLEGPTSSVVWLADGVLRTVQPGANGILAGTTQQLLFDRAAAAGWQTELGTATVDDLHSAEMVWLIGSVRGAVDVVEIDGRPRPRRPDIDRTIRALCGF